MSWLGAALEKNVAPLFSVRGAVLIAGARLARTHAPHHEMLQVAQQLETWVKEQGGLTSIKGEGDAVTFTRDLGYRTFFSPLDQVREGKVVFQAADQGVWARFELRLSWRNYLGALVFLAAAAWLFAKDDTLGYTLAGGSGVLLIAGTAWTHALAGQRFAKALYRL